MKTNLHARISFPRPTHAPGVALRAWLQASILAVSFHSLIAAEGPITAVQEALKREQFLSGEPSGVLDDATHAALRRFQIRRGLPVTGEIDAATLQALQNPAEAPQTPLPQPRGRGPTETTAEKDREFLQKVETGRAQLPPPVPVAPPPQPTARREAVLPETPSPAQTRETPARREAEPEPIASAQPHRVEPRTTSHRTVEIAVDEDPDILGPHGARILRPNAERRTYTYEQRIAPIPATPFPTARQDEHPAEFQRKVDGFFHRLFKGSKEDRADKEEKKDKGD